MFREPIIDKLKLSAVAAILALALGITAYADVLDMTRTDGSIEVTLKSEDTGEGIPGGSMTLYRAGYVYEDDGNYSFRLTTAFEGSGCSLDELNAELAKALADYAEDQEIEGRTNTIGSDGRVIFTDLEDGLYLLVQTEAAEGYYSVNPFVVSLPLYDEESHTYKYEVDATPKTEPVIKETPPPETTPHSGRSGGGGGGGSGSGGGGGSSSGGPGGSSGGEGDSGSSTWDLLPLPQTGQGWAMLIAICALIVAGIGLIVAFTVRRKE